MSRSLVVRHNNAILMAFLFAACQDAGAPTFDLRPALDIIDGANQTDTVTRTLPALIAARVRDSVTLQPARGVLVNWVVVSGGGSVFAGASVTNDSGLAREQWTLGPTAGAQVLEARAIVDGVPVVFARVTATALPGPLAYAGFVDLRRRGFGGDTFPLRATAADAQGNPLPLPPIQSPDGLPYLTRGDTVLAIGDRPGQFRFVLDDDTARVFVHVSLGAYEHVRTNADTTWRQTGQLALRWFKGTTDTIAEYRVVSYKSVRSVSGVATDSVMYTELTGSDATITNGFNHGVNAPGDGADFYYVLQLAPTATYQTSWTTLAARVGATWVFTQPGQVGVVDTVRVTQ